MADIFVRYVSFPRSVRGVTMPNDDTTFSVYINDRLDERTQRETYEHELAHIRLNHFYDHEPVVLNEREASAPLPVAAPSPPPLSPPQTPLPAPQSPPPISPPPAPAPQTHAAKPPTRREAARLRERQSQQDREALLAWEDKHLNPTG